MTFSITPIVVGAVVAWGLSQVLKVAVGLAMVGRSDINRVTWRLIWAGGMPSSHSAFVTSTVLLVGLTQGLSSALFGVAFVLAAVVIYDRTKLYHMYDVFQSRFPELRSAVRNDPMLRDLVGHTPAQVVVGILIGVASAAGTWSFIR